MDSHTEIHHKLDALPVYPHVNQYSEPLVFVDDETFGACAAFDGYPDTHLGIRDFRMLSDATFEAWVYHAPLAGREAFEVLSRQTHDGSDYRLSVMTAGPLTVNDGIVRTPVLTIDAAVHWFWAGRRKKGPFVRCAIRLPHVPVNTWYHVAGVLEGIGDRDEASLYIHDRDGKLIAHTTTESVEESDSMRPEGWAYIWEEKMAVIIIGPGTFGPRNGGKASDDGKKRHPLLRMAHVRVHNVALSKAEIEKDMASDLKVTVPFVQDHPIYFRLHDQDHQAAMYIVDDPAAQVNLQLKLTNVSEKVIEFEALPDGPPINARHHFALHFQPGTLSAFTQRLLQGSTPQVHAAILKENTDWNLAAYWPEGPTGWVVLYLSYKGSEKSPLTGRERTLLWEPQEQITLTLHSITAEAEGGSRGIQVEFVPQQMRYQGNTTEIAGSRTQQLRIASRRGEKNIPLHSWFIGGNTVVNDGKAHLPLVLRVNNHSQNRDILLGGKGDGAEKPKFSISFDTGIQGWELVQNASQVKVEAKVKNHRKQEVETAGHGQGARDKWEFTFPDGTLLRRHAFISDPSDYVEITITGLRTSLDAGPANLYLRYQNIPGYWDGEFVLTVEKRPAQHKEPPK